MPSVVDVSLATVRSGPSFGLIGKGARLRMSRRSPGNDVDFRRKSGPQENRAYPAEQGFAAARLECPFLNTGVDLACTWERDNGVSASSGLAQCRMREAGCRRQRVGARPHFVDTPNYSLPPDSKAPHPLLDEALCLLSCQSGEAYCVTLICERASEFRLVPIEVKAAFSVALS
jgi:hypothetical protein